jgi:hypothetical protein
MAGGPGTLLVKIGNTGFRDKEYDMVESSVFAAALFISFFMYAYYQE